MWVCDQKDDRIEALNAKVDWKDTALELRELRTWEGPEGGSTTNEGLEELRAKEGAKGDDVVWSWVGEAAEERHDDGRCYVA